MKTLLLVLIILAAAIGIGLFAHSDPGYVYVAYRGWSVESSFSLFLFMLALGFILFHLLWRLLSQTLNLPVRIRQWLVLRRSQRARRTTAKGHRKLLECQWAEAERMLDRAAPESDIPLLNHLGAAYAAQQLGAIQRRDHHLANARTSAPGAELAVGITKAELHLSSNQIEAALATLRHLRKVVPGHRQILNLLRQIYEKIEGWDELHDLLPNLKLHKVLSVKDLTELELRIQCHRLGVQENLQNLRECYRQIPRILGHHPDILCAYVNALRAQHDEAEAERVLSNILKQHWDPSLIRLYGMVQGADPERQLTTTEGWLKNHESDPDILLALGRLALRVRLWGKATSYLEASLGVEDRAETHCELGHLMALLGEQDKATEHFHRGLLLYVGDSCTPYKKMQQLFHRRVASSEPHIQES